MSSAGERNSRKSNVPHWWHQRVTAVALIPLGLWLALSLPGLDLGSQAALVAWMRAPMTAILLGLLALSAAYHSWLGVGEVLVDYVPDAGQLRVSRGLSLVLHLVALGVCFYAILRVAFGTA